MSPPRVLWRPQLPRGQQLTRGYIIRWHGVKTRGTFSDTWKSWGAETWDDTCVAAVTGHVTREDVSAQQPHAPGLPAVAQQPPQLQEADDQQARLPGPQWWAGASCFLNVSTKIVRAVWLSDEHSMRCVSSFPQCVELVWRLHRWEVNIFLKILEVDIFIFLLLRMRLWLYLWVCVRSLWARNVCLLGGDIDWAHLLINLSYLAWGMNMNNIIGLHL